MNFSSEDVPVSIGVIFDLSGSMANKFSYAKEAAVQFFKTVNPDDEGFLIGFSAHADLRSPFTNNIEELLTYGVSERLYGPTRWPIFGNQ